MLHVSVVSSRYRVTNCEKVIFFLQRKLSVSWFLQGWNLVPVLVELGSSAGETWFLYWWNRIPLLRQVFLAFCGYPVENAFLSKQKAIDAEERIHLNVW